jgi:hypothetical protein
MAERAASTGPSITMKSAKIVLRLSGGAAPVPEALVATGVWANAGATGAKSAQRERRVTRG